MPGETLIQGGKRFTLVLDMPQTYAEASYDKGVEFDFYIFEPVFEHSSTKF